MYNKLNFDCNAKLTDKHHRFNRYINLTLNSNHVPLVQYTGYIIALHLIVINLEYTNY